MTDPTDVEGGSGPLVAGVEMGGTKVSCRLARHPLRPLHDATFPTTGPDETLGRVVEHLGRGRSRWGPVRGVGLGSFGPVEIRVGHPGHGRLTATPKPGWPGVDVVGPVAEAIGAPVHLDTDVNAAALGESAHGHGRDVDSLVYLTIGTGIGGGHVVGGEIVGALGHPEMGHVAVARRAGDDVEGTCPTHGDCWEGLASGTAMRARWARPAEALTGAELDEAVRTEAWYLAAGLEQVVLTIAPHRIVLGGGVMSMPGLLEATRLELADRLGRYPGIAEHTEPGFVRSSGLDGLAGLVGATSLGLAAAGAAATTRRASDRRPRHEG